MKVWAKFNNNKKVSSVYTFLVGLKKACIRVICSSEVRYRSSYTKEAKIKFNPWLASVYSFKNIFWSTDSLEVGWFLLAQLVCDATFSQSLCEYLMFTAYSSLMVDVFLKRTRRSTPYKSLYGEAPPKRNILFRFQVYKRVGIYLLKYMKG